MRDTTTPHLMAFDTKHNDWDTTNAWRRMFLALIDDGSVKARIAIQSATHGFTNVAVSMAPQCPHTAEAAEAMRDVACCTCTYRALTASIAALRKTGQGVASIERELCDFIRTMHPEAPRTFATTGQRSRSFGPYEPLKHPVYPTSK